ncbi:uncharacterized protein TNCV_1371991 [Trichonephila clavipes]|nr:uncharacterized protein TNCV_1371991 [Trichonephila clavipes]
MVKIVRHNNESVREGYIRNGGKEVKLFTSALKAFQCNNRIVMAQRKQLNDYLRDRIIGRLDCGRTQLKVSEKESPQWRNGEHLGPPAKSGFGPPKLDLTKGRLWQRFQDNGNVSRCYSTGLPLVTTPNEDRYLAVTAKRNRRSTSSACLVSSLQLTVRQFQGGPCANALGTLVYMLVGLLDVFHLPQLTVT